MHASTLLTALALSAPALAHPGMGKALEEIKARTLANRQEDLGNNNVLVGGLENGITTDVGRMVADLITGPIEGLDGPPEKRRTTRAEYEAQEMARMAKRQECDSATDVCCVWFDVSADLTELFTGPTGRCNDAARGAVRLGFHDAGSWAEGQTNGGADGSFLMDFGEEDRPENNGLQQIRLQLREVQARHNVSFADLAQYAHNHATVTCPLGPQIPALVGRVDATQAAPTGLLPSAFDDADTLINLFTAKTFTTGNLIALIGAHTTGRQFHTLPDTLGNPFDSTPGVWDVAFYTEVLNQAADSRLSVLPSDTVLATDSRTSAAFIRFQNSQIGWNNAYRAAWARMQVLGISNTNSLVDCTRTLPAEQPNFVFADDEFLFE